ncbi:bacteriophage gp29 protein [Caballeronia catudaia]|uniref:Bacteriophage gp29 protein n=1 Tax=Caballeronia catudaia TaxID=1777136 RepID=A0A158B257_9BURK|nr:PAAR domain-containing protein [Caballeronia catudaia]SAK64162.1 bacteriophage gp29 protein [Caballeronia catudaia]
MRKAAVRHGDPTTTRGFVIAYSSTIFDDGRQVALSGDEATCGNCKGAYKIFGTGDGMTEKTRSVVVEGDRVLCPCGKNRVIVGSNPGIFLEVDSGTNSAQSAGSASFAGSPSPASVFDEAYVLRDDTTGRPLVNVFYRLTSTSGVVVEGMTDRSGKTQRIKTGAAERIAVKVGEAV